MLTPVACVAVPYFSYYKRHDFLKKVIENKSVF